MPPTHKPEHLAPPATSGPRSRRRAVAGFGRALAGLGERLLGSHGPQGVEAAAGKRRLEEVLERDRALCETREAPKLAAVPAPVATAAPAAIAAPAPAIAAPAPAIAAPANVAPAPIDLAALDRELTALDRLPERVPPKREADDGAAHVEPIRTRTMARLLAAQGYTKRALAIYEELAARDPDDVELSAQIRALSNARA